MRVIAAVAQDEVAAVTADEVADEADEVEGADAAESVEEAEPEAAASGENTKLYFGNLPYSVDSAQLADKPKPKEPLYPETEYKLFVGNLSWSVTSESLTNAFQEYGNVVGARVLYDGDTGKSRGYGFVCFATKAEMDTALESLNGMELEGRSMRVSLAEGKRS
uniref:RRM domain-containing protein n=1 Tax=Cannabis sativa TaxID=3483 RepID=A0A803Q4G4_CANSA